MHIRRFSVKGLLLLALLAGLALLCLKLFAAAPAQAASRLALAKRDVKAAEAMMAIDRDWAFSMACNAGDEPKRTSPG